MKIALNAEIVRTFLEYDRESGIFRWRVSPNRRIPVGTIAGTETRGRVQIKICGRLHRAHRLAWLYVYGKWPDKCIDHIDGNATNNRINNLRDVDHSVNNSNRHRCQRNNKLGVLGVSEASNKCGYRARIGHKHIGTFKTIEMAKEAYMLARAVSCA